MSTPFYKKTRKISGHIRFTLNYYKKGKIIFRQRAVRIDYIKEIARRVNAAGNLSAGDFENPRRRYKVLWEQAGRISRKLGALSLLYRQYSVQLLRRGRRYSFAAFAIAITLSNGMLGNISSWLGLTI